MDLNPGYDIQVYKTADMILGPVSILNTIRKIRFIDYCRCKSIFYIIHLGTWQFGLFAESPLLLSPMRHDFMTT